MHASSVIPVDFAKSRPEVSPHPPQLPPPQNWQNPSERSTLYPGLLSLMRTADSMVAQVQNETQEPQLPWFFTGVTKLPFVFRQSTAAGAPTAPTARRCSCAASRVVSAARRW